MRDTSWEKVSKWYGKTVGIKGHYYHEKVILPNVGRWLNLKKTEMVLDLACGQGILGREIEGDFYTGVDISPTLIKEAVKMDKNKKHRYLVGDITQKIKVGREFDWVTIILGLQNVESPYKVIKNAAEHLKNKGKLMLVINHPCFRIPQHSDWIVRNNRQYRMISDYMSVLKIPIESSPFDQKNNKTTWSFHYPLSNIVEMIADNGFTIRRIEEWISPKKSEGVMAEIEDKARGEIPLFMAIEAQRS